VDLQHFAGGEKREKPTPRRRLEARRQGRVFRSAEMTSAAVMVAGGVGLRLCGPGLMTRLQSLLRDSLAGLNAPDLTATGAGALSVELGWAFGGMILPLLAIAAVAAVGANVAQVGLNFTAEPLAPNLGRLNPVQGFTRLFSRRALVELVKALVKLCAVGWVTYSTVSGRLAEMPAMLLADLGPNLTLVGDILTVVAIRAGVVLLVLAAADFIYQRWEHELTLMMTRDELKEEFKNTEGHPQVKARIRQRQRQLAARRMMAAVKHADVVVTNPTHYAVALKYEAEKMAAPRVVARGRDLVAGRIRDQARRHGVPLVSNPPLARALYRAADVGDLVPPELYQAVAEVLAFVYSLKESENRGGRSD